MSVNLYSSLFCLRKSREPIVSGARPEKKGRGNMGVGPDAMEKVVNLLRLHPLLVEKSPNPLKKTAETLFEAATQWKKARIYWVRSFFYWVRGFFYWVRGFFYGSALCALRHGFSFPACFSWPPEARPAFHGPDPPEAPGLAVRGARAQAPLPRRDHRADSRSRPLRASAAHGPHVGSEERVPRVAHARVLTLAALGARRRQLQSSARSEKYSGRCHRSSRRGCNSAARRARARRPCRARLRSRWRRGTSPKFVPGLPHLS
jgi:hypothetical protein